MLFLARKGFSAVIKLTILLVFLCIEVLSETVFESKPVIVQSFENDTVLLPCYLNDNESKLRVRWYKDETLLGDTADPNQLLPPRLQLLANYTLLVRGLSPSDDGDYTCEVIRPEPWGPIRQVHSVKVQFAPKVKTIPEDGFLEVKKGDYVDFGCEATGNPSPTVTWKKNGEPMQLLEHRSRIRFKAENRHLGGQYQCVATNSVGAPAIGSLTLLIHDAPIATAVRNSVHSAVGLRAVLAARLDYSVPAPRTNWYRAGRPVHFDDRIIQMVQDNIHQLIFRAVRLSDFGNYTFRAENKLGMADVSFKLTGVPNVASFKVDSTLNRPSASSYTLIWEVDSYSTIIEYNLWLRPYTGASPSEAEHATRWSKIHVPADSTDGPIHSASYTVRGLTPSTVYEAIVASRNGFGWSKPSSILHFATDEGVYRTPSTSDYSETPVLEDIEDNVVERHNSTVTQLAITNRSEKMKNTAFSVAILSSILCYKYVL